MKCALFLIILTYLSSPVFSAETNTVAVDTNVQTPEAEVAQNSLGLTEADLEFVLDDQAIKQKYEACKKLYATESLTSNVSGCLWGDVAGKPELGLTDSEKEKVIAKIDQLAFAKNPEQESASADANKDRFESLDTGFLKEANKDPAFLALQKFMKEKLEKTIYGEVKKGELKTTDHMVFHDLYKSQLSQNVISAMSSYCLDADPNTDFLVPDSKEGINAQRKINIDQLKKQDVTTDKNGKKTLVAQENYSNCIGALKKVCYNKNDWILKSKEKSELEEEEPQSAETIKKLRAHRYIEDSNIRACTVVKYVKQLKQNLIAVDDISKRMKVLGVDNVKAAELSSNLAHNYRGEKNEILNNMSSKEFIEDSGFKAAAENESKEFEKCITTNDQGEAQVVDEKACEKYLNKDKEAAAKMITEEGLRTRALGDKISKSLKNGGDKGIEAYLADQGYEPDEIKNMLENPELIADQINERYDAERQAYIKSLSDRIRAKTIEDDKPIAESTETKGKLEVIGSELKEKTKAYTELIHFNNIVSGFLMTEDEDKKLGRNTNAMAIELNGGSAYNPSPSGPSAEDGRSTASSTGTEAASAHIDAIKEVLNSNDINPVLDEGGSNTLQKNEINKIFDYDLPKTAK